MKSKSLKILVVDDDHNFAHTLCAILKTAGHSCQEAHSVDDAKQILFEEEFDFVLSDVKMQGQSGADLYYQVKDRLPNLPFILMTAYTSSEIIDDALKAGVLAAFQKPIDIEGILEYFAQLSQSLKGAIICKDVQVCDLIRRIMDDRKYSFTLYKTIDQVIQSGIGECSIALIDAHERCDQLTDKINLLAQKITGNLIIIICDFRNTFDAQRNFNRKINLVVLSRESSTEYKIRSIIENQYFLQAKKILL